MQRLLVMTVIGQDRPGLVESVAALVAEHGGWARGSGAWQALGSLQSAPLEELVRELERLTRF